MNPSGICRVFFSWSGFERGYTVVHQYKNNGYNILLDVNSGAIHVVDDIVYDVVPFIEEGLKQKKSQIG